MQYRHLRKVEFSVEPIKNVVGVGGRTAYQIVVTPRANFATHGLVNVPAYAEVCNDPAYSMNNVDESVPARLAARMKRALATLKF